MSVLVLVSSTETRRRSVSVLVPAPPREERVSVRGIFGISGRALASGGVEDPRKSSGGPSGVMDARCGAAGAGDCLRLSFLASLLIRLAFHLNRFARWLFVPLCLRMGLISRPRSHPPGASRTRKGDGGAVSTIIRGEPKTVAGFWGAELARKPVVSSRSQGMEGRGVGA